MKPGSKSTSQPLIAVPKPTTVEKVAGSNVVTGAAALASVYLGDLAGFLPTLADTLARGRQTARVEQSIQELEAGLNALNDQVRAITDDQYKVISEAATAMFSTVDEKKLDILRAAAIEAVRRPGAVDGVAEALGRLLRDMSVSEVTFLARYHKAPGFSIGLDDGSENGTIVVDPDTEHEIAMSGLISLGLLYTRSSTWDAQMYEWSPLVPRLVQLLAPETP